MRKAGRIIRIVVIVILCGVMAYSGYQIYRITERYREESKVHEETMVFDPAAAPIDEEEEADPALDVAPDQPYVAPSIAPEQPKKKKKNLTLSQAVGKYPDVVGWLKVSNTQINYLFVRGEDNDYYLNHDIYGDPAVAGSIFMDARCQRDFSSFNTVLFGHHMRNGSMFANLDKFKNKAFFDANPYGMVYLPDTTYHIDFFAVCVVKSNDDVYKHVNAADGQTKADYYAYVKSIARHYRELDLGENDRLITLSTCNYEFENARAVLIGRLVEVVSPTT